MNKLLNHLRIRSERLYITLKTFFKWLLLSGITGICCGVIGSLFHLCMEFATEFRTGHSFMVYFLPVAGLAIVFLYSICGLKNDPGTNIIITSIRTEGKIPVRMAPLIFISAFITHLFGGSAGREGAALQLGGSIGAGVFYYSAIVPCFFSAAVALGISHLFGIVPVTYKVVIPDISVMNIAFAMMLGVGTALLSIVFCYSLHKLSKLLSAKIKNNYIRIFVCGCVIVILTAVFGTDYNGAGMNIIADAMSGTTRPEAFALKLLFTVITIAGGYKGGEIVPSFFIGATFGNLFGTLVGLPPQFTAALGLVSLFCGVVNCPVTSLLLSIEIFGGEGIIFFAAACSVSYILSGYYGLYTGQKIMYSKLHSKYINRHTK